MIEQTLRFEGKVVKEHEWKTAVAMLKPLGLVPTLPEGALLEGTTRHVCRTCGAMGANLYRRGEVSLIFHQAPDGDWTPDLATLDPIDWVEAGCTTCGDNAEVEMVELDSDGTWADVW